MIYQIEIREYLSKIIEIDAPTPKAAIEIAEGMYEEEEVVLDYNDFKGYDINIYEE